jgi:V-type H+-transporting ATPase subunit A
MRVLGPFFDVIDADFSSLREIARDLLQQEKDLSEIVQLVGRDSLSEDQKVCARADESAQPTASARLHFTSHALP